MPVSKIRDLRSSRLIRHQASRALRSALLLVLVLGFVAASPGIAEARNSPARKFARGTANMSLGVLALPVTGTGRE